MITTTYKCDRCGHEQTNNSQMWRVGISYCHQQYSNSKSIRNEQLWCRKCCDLFNFITAPEKPKEGQPAPVPVTLDDQIREIMREEIEAATGARA